MPGLLSAPALARQIPAAPGQGAPGGSSLSTLKEILEAYNPLLEAYLFPSRSGRQDDRLPGVQPISFFAVRCCEPGWTKKGINATAPGARLSPTST